MDLCLPADFFLTYDAVAAHCKRDGIDLDPLLGADAHVYFSPPAFITGLRDWRRTTAVLKRRPAHAADADWQPV